MDARNRHSAVLERLTQDLERRLRELRQLVEEQHAVMRERDLAGPRHAAAADHRDHRRRVVRAAERPLLHEAAARWQEARDAVDLRDLECLLAREARQDGAQAAREHRLARPRHADHQEIVAARRRNLECSLRLELPLHIGKVIAKHRGRFFHRRHSWRK